MELLLDTSVLLWTIYDSDRLAAADRNTIEDPDNDVAFSPISIWEIAIKFGLGRPDFVIRPETVLAQARLMGVRGADGPCGRRRRRVGASQSS